MAKIMKNYEIKAILQKKKYIYIMHHVLKGK